MKFRTTVETAMKGVQIRPEDGITLLGSCFAGHIGQRMARAGLDTHANPFGVLYNPMSVAAWCKTMATGKPLPDDVFFESGGLWHSWLNDSSFSAASREACRTRLEGVCHEEAARTRSLKMLFLTLGTNRYYRLNVSGRVVGNCHKQPGSCFTEEQSDVEGTTAALAEALEALWQINPSLQVVFTVSPYRYAKYGFHGNRLGKAVLLLAVDTLCRAYEGRCFYFPAYEIVLDELRDYRFYASDMLHLSEVAAEYVWERFSEACFPEETRRFMVEWEAVDKALSHRPLHPESAAYRDFLRQTMSKLELLAAKYPRLAHGTAYERLESLLKH